MNMLLSTYCCFILQVNKLELIYAEKCSGSQTHCSVLTASTGLLLSFMQFSWIKMLQMFGSYHTVIYSVISEVLV